MAEPARGLIGKRIKGILYKLQGEREKLPIGKKSLWENNLKWVKFISTSALAAGEEKRGGTVWMGIGPSVNGSRISPY
jgi:hypothetical protein